MDPLAWSALLLVLGLVLVMVEVFVPSGGILGFLSIASRWPRASFWRFITEGSKPGFLFLVITAVAVPTVLTMAFRWWPKTPMGRRRAAGRAQR